MPHLVCSLQVSIRPNTRSSVHESKPNCRKFQRQSSRPYATPFVSKVPALVKAWFPGQEAGHSLALVLSGAVNPSGRLPFSWSARDEDNPTFGNCPCDQDNIVRYAEGLDVGYRYYDRQNTPAPLFPFGFGLGYETDFRDSNLRLLDPTILSLGSDPEGLIRFTCSVKNHGTRGGATVL